MWRLNLTSIHQMIEDENPEARCEWELVKTTGRGPGKISHHTAQVRPSKEVVFYGGLKGEDSNAEFFMFNPNTNAWSSLSLSVSDKPWPTKHDFAVTNFASVEWLCASATPRRPRDE